MAERLKVGDKLWYVHNSGYGQEVVVSKIGRKWAEISYTTGIFNLTKRLALETMAVFDGNYACGRCYVDASDFRETQRRNNLTFAFRRAVSKAGYVWTCEQIEQAAAILGITLPGDEQ